MRGEEQGGGKEMKEKMGGMTRGESGRGREERMGKDEKRIE